VKTLLVEARGESFRDLAVALRHALARVEAGEASGRAGNDSPHYSFEIEETS
jgi:hypothetical protein